jgi:hypothetical protein
LDEVAEVARLLRAHEAGERAAFDQLVPPADELRRLAHSHLQRVPGAR